MKNLATTAIIAALLYVPSMLSAQDDTNTQGHQVSIVIPEVALLDLEGGSAITLTPSEPDEAGEAFNFGTATNSDIWVNYSSVVAAGVDREVTVAITSGTVPAGLNLKVAAGTYSGSGKGTFGSSAGVVTLSSTAQDLITGVGSSWTGDGSQNGHQLTYNLELTSADAYSLLANATTPITVTYTLTEDQ